MTFSGGFGRIMSEVIDVIFKERLKKARTRAGLTQAEAAQKCGFANDAVYRKYENGRIPTATTLAVVANALDVSADWLLGLSRNMEIRDRIPPEETNANDDN